MSDDKKHACCALFATAIGRVGMAWADGRITAMHLPEETDAQTILRLQARAGSAVEAEPPPEVERAIDAITALLSGERIDLSFIDCDYSGLDPFNIRVYDIARTIPAGRTMTYGEIATRLGDGRLAQAVGQALGRNPFPIVVPCHRVMGANGRLTGFSANGGTMTKLRLLNIEGAKLGETPALFSDLPLAVKPAQTR